MFRLFPHRVERPMYGLFGELAELLVRASDTHSRLLGHTARDRARIAPRLHENATTAEELTRRISNRITQSLITPYEAELLYDLALTIADTLDAMEHTAELLVMSRAGKLPTPLLEAAKLIERSAELTVEATWELGQQRRLGDFYARIRRNKRQGDRLTRQALGELYRRGGASAEMLALHDVTESISRTIALQERTGRLADLLRVKDA